MNLHPDIYSSGFMMLYVLESRIADTDPVGSGCFLGSNPDPFFNLRSSDLIYS